MSRSFRAVSGALLTALIIVGFTCLRTGRAQEIGSGHNGPTLPQTNRPDENFVPGRILLKFRAGTSDARSRSLLAAYGARAASRIPGIDVHVVELPPSAIEEHFAQTFRAFPEVEFAELDRIVEPADMTPNDPWYANWEWHLKKIQAPAAWATTTGSSNVVIAILDTGVDASHEDLAAKIVPGWNVYNNNSDSSDVYGHGTKVAGTAGASSNNAIGVASVAWGCKIMPIRISGTDGYATYSAMASGLNWAADHGARVANISYSATESSTVKSAAQYFQAKGGVVTMAAGNDSAFHSSTDNPYILTVSATDQSDVIASFSDTGNNVDLSAPQSSYSTVRGGGYDYVGGTSFSAPIVAGVAALILSVNPSLTPSQVQDILKKNSDDLGAPGWDPIYGNGRVNAARAVSAATGNVDTILPTVSFISPASGATVSGLVSVEVSASDNVGVSSVSLSVDGNSIGSDANSPYTFSWGTSATANGSHTLTATVKDGAGNSSSFSVLVTVNNTAPAPDAAPPTVVITSPADGAKVSGVVSAFVSASDNSGVVRSELYVDGVLAATTTAAPFTTKWNTRKVSAGAHRLQCKAYDAAGNVGVSQIVTVYR